MSTYNRAVLFVNGEAKDLTRIQLCEQDYLVAVDGGYRHLAALGLTPHLLIGDLDSVDPESVSKLQAAGVEVLKYPPAKDQTDLELALYQVIAQGFKRVLVLAALGGRLDHTLGNLALLSQADFDALEISLDDGLEQVLIVREAVQLAVDPGDTISLLPVCSPVQGIKTKGLAYPLDIETLYPNQTRGISNVAISSTIQVVLESGTLMLIHTRMNKNLEMEVNDD